MDCPFLKYEDTGWSSWRYWCTAISRKVGDEYNKTQVECTCKNSHFYDCPYYRSKRG